MVARSVCLRFPSSILRSLLEREAQGNAEMLSFFALSVWCTCPTLA